MKVAVIQHDIDWEDAAATTKRVSEPIAQAATSGARLVVLSEMFATGFSMAPERVAEPEGGPIETFLREQAQLHDCWLVGSIAQTRTSTGQPEQDKPANVAVVAGPGGELHRYAKIHPFRYGGEHEHYRAGDQLLTVDVEGLRVGVFVCYDLRFADVFWVAGPDVDCFVVMANWPAKRHEHWRLLLRARAVENLAYVVGANRVGVAPGLRADVGHAGGSVVIDPLGERLVEARSIETVIVADVDAQHVRAVRERFGFLADRTGRWS